MKKIVFFVFLLLSVGFAHSSNHVWTAAQIDQITSRVGTFGGGCYARISLINTNAGSKIDQLPGFESCHQDLVTFSCNLPASFDQTESEKEVAYANFDLAKMAFALNKNIRISIIKSRPVNGICNVDVIDVLR